MDKIEFLILKNLLHNEDYLRKVVPFLKGEYFQDSNQKIVYEEIFNFVTQYNEVPSKEILSINLAFGQILGSVVNTPSTSVYISH